MFFLLVVLAIFVDWVLLCFWVEKNSFHGDSALFGNSFDSLLNLDNTSIILTTTRFNVALLFFLIYCRISSSVHWSNKVYRWSISLYISPFMAAVVVYSPKTFTIRNISLFPTLSDFIGTLDVNYIIIMRVNSLLGW